MMPYEYWRLVMKSKIDKDALANYSEFGYPKLFKQIGQQGFDGLTQHDKLAVNLVSKLKECEEIIHVAFSESRSNYPDFITTFIRCKSGKTFYVTNGQLI